MNRDPYDVRDVKCVGGPYDGKTVQFYNWRLCKVGDRVPDASLHGGQNEKQGHYYVGSKESGTLEWQPHSIITLTTGH